MSAEWSKVVKDSKTKNALHQMDHLLALAKQCAIPCPALSRSYARQAQDLGLEAKITVADEEVQVCPYCSTLLLPGFNCSVRIESAKHRKGTKQGREGALLNEVKYTCAFCGKGPSLEGTRVRTRKRLKRERCEAKMERHAKKQKLVDQAKNSRVDPRVAPDARALNGLPGTLKDSLFFRFQCEDSNQGMKAKVSQTLRAPAQPKPQTPTGAAINKPAKFSFASPVATTSTARARPRSNPGKTSTATTQPARTLTPKTPLGKKLKAPAKAPATSGASAGKRRRKAGYLLKGSEAEAKSAQKAPAAGGLSGLYNLLQSFK